MKKFGSAGSPFLGPAITRLFVLLLFHLVEQGELERLLVRYLISSPKFRSYADPESHFVFPLSVF